MFLFFKAVLMLGAPVGAVMEVKDCVHNLIALLTVLVDDTLNFFYLFDSWILHRINVRI